VQIKIDPELASFRIVPSWGEVTHDRFRGRATGTGWENEFHVVIETERGESREVVAPQNYPPHLRCQVIDPRDGELSPLRLMTGARDMRKVTHEHTT
jgi:hypothetical protein